MIVSDNPVNPANRVNPVKKSLRAGARPAPTANLRMIANPIK
jgi:hypothetical protein